MTTPKLGLPEITESQASKYVTHNQALNDLDAIVQLSVVDRDLAEPPGSPVAGNAYIIASAPSAGSPWVAGSVDDIAYYYQSSWSFLTPSEGWQGWLLDENVRVVYTSTGWAATDPYKLPVTYVSVDTSVTNAQSAQTFGVQTAGATTIVYLPEASTVSNGFVTAVFKATGDGNPAIVNGNGTTVDGSTTFRLPYQYDSIYLVCDTSAWHSIQKSVQTATVLAGIEFKGYTETFVTASVAAGTTTLSLASANVFDLPLTANASVVFGNVASGKAVSATVFTRQDATGNRTFNVVNAVYASGQASTVTANASAEDMWTFVTKDAGATWYGSRAGGKFA